MPWISEEPPSDETGRVWHSALKHALLRRLQADEVQSLVHELMQKHAIRGADLAEILMGFRAVRKGTDDPLLFQYAKLLLKGRCFSPWHLLEALLRTSKFMRPESVDPPRKLQQGLPACEERMFNLITQLFMADELQVKLEGAHDMLRILAHWMHVAAEYEAGKQLDPDNIHALDIYAFGMYEALASLAITAFGSRALRPVTKLSWWKKRRSIIVSEMENFDSHVLIWMGSQLAGRLRALTSMPPFMECDKQGRPVFTDQQVLNSIPDLPVQTTRAGLYIWLNACLTARPLTNDMSILAYLQARYSGDNQSSAIALIQASFDVLTNAVLRKDSEHNIKVIRSFICNKVPMMLNTLGSFMMAPASVESCVQAAFESITMDAVPPITAGSAEGRDKLKLARKEFLQAVALQGLLSEHMMSTILMEPSVSIPRVTRYTKDSLYAQCSNSVGRLEHFVDELDGMVGNAGAISGCIVDVISNLCGNKDTMSLKTVCNMLVKHNSTMDIVLQYAQPATLLTPICTRLNEWTHDQEQAEFTPAYEEFASMLLYVLTIVHRYGLEIADLGLPAENTFVAQLLQNIADSKKTSDLDPEQSSQLSKWVEGLYAVDDSGETNGISDEVMRQCPPQVFYQMVPTLFEQSVLACKSNALSMKLFKGGIELLLEPFLLPCLVGGLSWVAKHSWEDHGDADVLLQALDKLLRQNSASMDAKSMHNAILGIVANPLCHTLEVLISRKPNQRTEKQVNGLLEILKPYRNRKRTMQCSKTELATWTATTGGGFAEHLRIAAQEQITWSLNIGPAPPSKYTHRLVAASTATLGADATLDVLISELKEQTTIGNGSLAFDICSAMICAPTTNSGSAFPGLDGHPQSETAQLTLREALRLRISNVQALLKLPSSTAQALVRLSRVVQAQMAVTPMAQLPMPNMTMAPEAADQVMAELGLTDDTLTTAGAGMSMDQGIQLDATTDANFTNADIEAALNQPTMDLGDSQQTGVPGLQTQNSGLQNQGDDIFADLGVDLSQPVQNQNGSNQGADEDIFAGLNMTMDMDDFDFS